MTHASLIAAAATSIVSRYVDADAFPSEAQAVEEIIANHLGYGSGTPTTEGYYWYCRAGMQKWDVCHVVNRDGQLWVLNENEGGPLSDVNPKLSFRGPIAPPDGGSKNDLDDGDLDIVV